MAVTAGSVIDAIPAAFRRMARTLFQPFDVRKWFVLGFCAWLAQLGEGGGPNFNVGGGGGGGPGGGGGGFGDFGDWFEEHLAVILLVAAAIFLVALALGLLIVWLSSRGKFMFLDGVVHNRGAVVDPWHRYRSLANSLFAFRVVFGLVVLLALALVGAVCFGLAWIDIARETFGPAALIAIVIGVLSFLVIVVSAAIISGLLDDFVVPVMYLRERRVLEAWRVFWRELGQGHVGPILLFYLMKIILGMGVAAVAMIATCLTCCLTVLPYLGTVILLPLFVFLRCYSLAFIEQYGPDWQMFAYDLEAPGTPASE
jgi:hypothetical protein